MFLVTRAERRDLYGYLSVAGTRRLRLQEVVCYGTSRVAVGQWGAVGGRAERARREGGRRWARARRGVVAPGPPPRPHVRDARPLTAPWSTRTCRPCCRRRRPRPRRTPCRCPRCRRCSCSTSTSRPPTTTAGASTTSGGSTSSSTVSARFHPRHPRAPPS